MSGDGDFLPDPPEQKRRVRIVEDADEAPTVLVIWPMRRCPFCESRNVYQYGKTRDGTKRFYRCQGCRKTFKAREQ